MDYRFLFKKLKKLPVNKFDKKIRFHHNRKENLLMKILFLGDIVGDAGCIAVKKHLKTIIEKNKIDYWMPVDVYSWRG